MNAPDPTADEREVCEQPGHRCPDCSAPRVDGVFGEGAAPTGSECANPECDHDRTVPSPGCAYRAASTGTSEDVEALLLRHGGYKPAPVGQGWRCWCDADLRPFWPNGGVTARDTAINYALRAHLAVVFAAREAAARAEERERVAQAIEVRREALDEAFVECKRGMEYAARITREAGTR